MHDYFSTAYCAIFVAIFKGEFRPLTNFYDGALKGKWPGKWTVFSKKAPS